ncbi:nuclear transport factor 2 family protein [Aquirufa nivalisilvae]|uniref:nuclear transport factor 2 family protein n=1 Tax=Aquirufa nivalisilvae TaxID=2516557 RepID=UPI0022A9C504|nr:nuclear transport factor 2 family protein [Aquirufa nivalisilvae]MCZ2479162.1 nuclear transport factor 2 family protein [Aquirufa nivalisilvae]
MRNCFYLSLLFILLGLSDLHAQTSLDSLHQPIIRFFDGFSQLNTALFRQNTTPDLILLEAGMIWNIDTLVNKVKPNPTIAYERKNSFTFLTSEQKGDVAWVTYWNQAEIHRGDQIRNARWLESVVLVRQSGRWKIRLMHSTPMPK